MVKQVLLVLLLMLTVWGRPSGVSLYCPVSSKWSGKKCECQAGMINLNGKCVCDYGYSAGTNGCQKCTLDSTGKNCQGATSNCQPESTWNGYICIFNWKANNCGPSGYWNGVACSKLTYPIVCDAGYRWNGQVCALFIVSTCPDGYFWNGKQCTGFKGVPTCISAFAWDSGTGSCINANPQKCQPGNFWSGSACQVNTTQIRCNPGNYMNGISCIPLSNTVLPLCASGFFWTGKACRSSPNQTCDQSYYFDSLAGGCLLKVCQTNFTFAANGSVCISISEDNNTLTVKTSNTAVNMPAAGSGPVNVTTRGPAGTTSVSVDQKRTVVTRSQINGSSSGGQGQNPPGGSSLNGTIGNPPVNPTNPPIRGSLGSPRPVTSTSAKPAPSQISTVNTSAGGIAIAGPGTVSVAGPGTVVVNGVNTGQQPNQVAKGTSAPPPATQPTKPTPSNSSTTTSQTPTSPKSGTTTVGGNSTSIRTTTSSPPGTVIAVSGNTTAVAVGTNGQNAIAVGENGQKAVAVGGGSLSSGNGVAIGGTGIGISGGSTAISTGTVSGFGLNFPDNGFLNADVISTLNNIGSNSNN